MPRRNDMQAEKTKRIKPVEAQDNMVMARVAEGYGKLRKLYQEMYSQRPDAHLHLEQLMQVVRQHALQRPLTLKQRDAEKATKEHAWYLNNQLAGMSLYVDRFAGNLKAMHSRLDYLQDLGINFLHLMPVMESPALESDGGYAVSDFRKVDERFGTMDDLVALQKDMQERGMYLMIDIVLNHTSHHHEWAQKAKAGEKEYQDFYYFFADRQMPDAFEQSMPEIFPEAAPGNFTYIAETGKWVMTVFHHYQWDLNYSNPAVLTAMIDNILFYANLGVDVLRIDAPAFIWKKLGTDCQNLDEAHQLLTIIRQCVDMAAPGMALLGEAIVAPAQIIKYFGTNDNVGKECQFAYNATHMALQWDALATTDTRVMLAAQHLLWQKPYGCSWITYTRCHDDIGLGYDDSMIAAAGFDPWQHRKFIKDYYTGNYDGSDATGALFAVNPKTQDARISGTLASLCGLENALASGNAAQIDRALQRIILMQAHSIFLGGLPMLFYGDELAMTNDFSYQQDEGKSYDNRWMHRPIINWDQIDFTNTEDISTRVYHATQKLLTLRRKLPAIADLSNIEWMTPHNIHVAGYIRRNATQTIYCLFNFSFRDAYLTWYAFREKGMDGGRLHNHVNGDVYEMGTDRQHLVIPPYGFMLLEQL